MSSNDRKEAMLGELLGELEYTRRGRTLRKRLGAGVAVMFTVGAGAVIAMMSLSSRPAAAPTVPITTGPTTAPTIERITTDPSILERVRVVADSSQIERIQTRPMPELRVNDDQLVALMANTDQPVGVVRIGGEAFIVSAKWEEPGPHDPNDTPM